jgi:hypothetical protein
VCNPLAPRIDKNLGNPHGEKGVGPYACRSYVDTSFIRQHRRTPRTTRRPLPMTGARLRPATASARNSRSPRHCCREPRLASGFAARLGKLDPADLRCRRATKGARPEASVSTLRRGSSTSGTTAPPRVLDPARLRHRRAAKGARPHRPSVSLHRSSVVRRLAGCHGSRGRRVPWESR